MASMNTARRMLPVVKSSLLPLIESLMNWKIDEKVFLVEMV